MPLALSVSLLAGPVLSAAESPAPAREKTSSEAPAAEKKVAAPSKAAEKTKSASRVKNYVLREDVLDYLAQVSKNENIPLDWLKKEVAAARYSPLTQKYSTPKPNANRKTTPERNFALYKRNLLTEERIADGVDFVARNRATLERLEKELGVDRHVVAAVIGIESIYGKNMGRFRVIDALMTLSFDYTRRASYYKKELAAYLAYCHREGLSVTTVRGSFAGAIGLGQFMPTSLFAYGKDGNGDGYPDDVNVSKRLAVFIGNYPDHYETYRPKMDGPFVPSVKDEKGHYIANAAYKDVPGAQLRIGNLPRTESTGVHSIDDLVVGARGPHADAFRGFMNSTEVFRIMSEALALGNK